ncbi:MAG: fibronectin type III domain-containing protein [Halococcoides sp.]
MTRHTTHAKTTGIDAEESRGSRAGNRSRRQFLRTISAGASVAVLGGIGTAAAREVNGDSCLSNGGGSLRTGDVRLFKNNWSTAECGDAPVEICISTYSDGSFGWEWERGYTCVHGEDLPNYPEALMGTKIGGTSSGWGGLPKRMDDIDRLDVELDVEMDLSDGEWNFALEWWMSPNRSIGNATDEIMVVLDDSPAHDKGKNEVTAAFEDKYGNVYDYWENDIQGGDGAGWNFHIFHIPEEGVPYNLDLRSLIDYIIEDPDGMVAEGGGNYDGSKYIGGIEIGNENWDNTNGETILNQFSVRVNDTVGAAGLDDDFTVHETDDTPPSMPANLAVADRTETTATITWSASSDDGSGVAEYVVSVDGSERSRVAAGRTRATISGLSADQSYAVEVIAVDGAGNRSDPATVTVPSAGPNLDPIEGTVPKDLDGDGRYEDVSANGLLDFPDVNQFFRNSDRAVVTDHVEAYDFKDDGTINLQDVMALFRQI